MKSTLTIKSKDKNNYLYNRKNKSLLLSHPVFIYLLELEKSGKNIDEMIYKIKDDLYIESYGHFSKNEVLYYYKKINFLKSNKQFDTLSYKNTVDLEVTKDIIIDSFANSDNITFEVTQKCNLNCTYCAYGQYYEWFDKRSNNDLQLVKAKNLLDYYISFVNTKYNPLHKKNFGISFYGGEPLLNFTFIKEIVNYLKNIKNETITFDLLMTTNGILIEKYSEFLVENDFHLIISLDGDEKNNKYRIFKNNKPAFNEIYKNIIYLKNNYPNYFENNVGFNSVLHNYNSVDEIFTFFLKEFNKIPIINEVNPDGLKKEKQKSFLKMYKNYETSLKQFEDYSYISIKDIVNSPDFADLREFINSSNSFLDYFALLSKSNTKYATMTSTCYPFYDNIFLTVNGKLLPCENVDNIYCLGIVTNKEVKIDFEAVAIKYTEYFEKMKSQCFNCYFQTNCSQCLLFLDIESDKPVCNGFINKHQDYCKYISSRIEMIEEKPERYINIMNE